MANGRRGRKVAKEGEQLEAVATELEHLRAAWADARRPSRSPAAGAESSETAGASVDLDSETLRATVPRIPVVAPMDPPEATEPPTDRPPTVGVEVDVDVEVDLVDGDSHDTEPPSHEARLGQHHEQQIAMIRTLVADGQFEETLAMGEDVLRENPLDKDATEYVATALLAMLGHDALRRVPVLTVQLGELATLPIDACSWILLGQVNGTVSLGTILDRSGMRQLDGLRRFLQLKRLRAIRLD